MKTGIEDAVGKTINGIVITENNRPPYQQVFLTFTNGYHLELWGNDIHSAGGLDKGDVGEIVKYAEQGGATVQTVRSGPRTETALSREENEIKKFELTEDDGYAITIAKNTATRFLQSPKLTPDQRISLCKALVALERLPEVTPDIFVEFGLQYREGDEDCEEMHYVNFIISPDIFEILEGGSVYNKSIGGDNFSSGKWTVELQGFRKTDCDLVSLEGEIDELLNRGAEITIYEESYE